MSLRKNLNWVLSGLGLFTVALSLIFVFSTPVFAACSASVQCPGSDPVECSCSAGGACTSDSNSVSCGCQGKGIVRKICPAPNGD